MRGDSKTLLMTAGPKVRWRSMLFREYWVVGISLGRKYPGYLTLREKTPKYIRKRCIASPKPALSEVTMPIQNSCYFFLSGTLMTERRGMIIRHNLLKSVGKYQTEDYPTAYQYMVLAK